MWIRRELHPLGLEALPPTSFTSQKSIPRGSGWETAVSPGLLLLLLRCTRSAGLQLLLLRCQICPSWGRAHSASYRTTWDVR